MEKLPLLTWIVIAVAVFTILAYVAHPVPDGCVVKHYYEFPYMVCSPKGAQ